jgi:hypothetical protein
MRMLRLFVLLLAFVVFDSTARAESVLMASTLSGNLDSNNMGDGVPIDRGF